MELYFRPFIKSLKQRIWPGAPWTPRGGALIYNAVFIYATAYTLPPVGNHRLLFLGLCIPTLKKAKNIIWMWCQFVGIQWSAREQDLRVCLFSERKHNLLIFVLPGTSDVWLYNKNGIWHELLRRRVTVFQRSDGAVVITVFCCPSANMTHGRLHAGSRAQSLRAGVRFQSGLKNITSNCIHVCP